MKFSELDLNEDLLASIDSIGFDETTPIQEQAIPIILQGKDLIACAQTGTGKTAAYLIPTIEKLMHEDSHKTRVLIISPTRELADQIDRNVEALSYFTGISSVAVFGGKGDWDKQTYAIRHGADIIIATPGRLNTHAALGYLNFDSIEVLILDEADKMLDMGFHPDILKIVSQLSDDRQTLMFSATMPKNIRKLAKEILKEPEEINLNIAKPAAGINQMAFSVYDEQKIPLLEHLIKEREVESMIIFASKKSSVDQITRKLIRLGYGAKAIHSDKEQSERMETLREFKNGKFPIIIGTDVLARGIDIDSLSHVLNFDVPLDAEDYVHRVGRTARASSTGEAITFINPTDQRRFRSIEELIEMEIPKPEVPKELGEVPVYDPARSPRQKYGRGGGGRKDRSDRGSRRGRDSRSGDRKRSGGGGGSRRSGGGEHRRRKPNLRNALGASDRPKEEQNVAAPEGKAPAKKNKRKRRRPGNRKPKNQAPKEGE